MAGLLEIRNLEISFRRGKGWTRAASGVSLSVGAGEIVSLVGESGSGKSVTALSILGLLPRQGKVTAGEILLDGKNLLALPEVELDRVRGRDIAMIFQDIMYSLNPVFTIGQQITETICLHLNVSKKEAKNRAIDLLQKVQIPDAAKRLGTYPHQLSGGMRQRVMICMALACSPKLLIADEPTTALDVTIQAQILDLIRKLRDEEKTAVLFITHDLGVVADIAHRAVVMYAGCIMEMGTVHDMFLNPLHPYTQGLLSAIPRLSTPHGEKLYTIRGIVPDLSMLPQGCVFSTRCDQCMEICRQKRPPLRQLDDGRQVRCFRVEGGKELD